MAQGNSGFANVIAFFALIGGAAILLRLTSLRFLPRGDHSPSTTDEYEKLGDNTTSSFIRRLLSSPLNRLILFLLVGTLFLPAHPWRHMTSTITYDVIRTLGGALVTRGMHGSGSCDGDVRGGSNPLGDLKYSPAADPYYVSNLHQPINPFIAEALKDTNFTNVVHIVLESMREDSYPYQEDGLLHQHILKNLAPAKGGTPISTQTITPFIDSLSENIISWHTMWSSIPYTHKAMLGRIFPTHYLF
jgi:hypothetical protein